MKKKKNFRKMKRISQMMKMTEKEKKRLAGKGEMKTVGDILAQKEARNLKAYAAAIVKKFGKYIKSVVPFGSAVTKFKKTESSDIDVAIVVDNTDVKRMSKSELKDKLLQKLVKMSYPYSKKIHPQAYLLTEFWKYIREGNPVLYNVLRTGTPIYDTGFFLPIQILLKKGLINPSREAVDKHIRIANKLLDKTEKTILKKLTKNLHLAAVSSAQAVLMEMGYRPPTQKEVPKFVEKHLVEEEGLDKKYAEMAEELIFLYKDVEHGRKEEVTGKELDEYLEKAKEFVDKMNDVLEGLREEGEEEMYEIFKKKEEEKIRMERDGMIDIEEETKTGTEEMAKELGRRE